MCGLVLFAGAGVGAAWYFGYGPFKHNVESLISPQGQWRQIMVCNTGLTCTYREEYGWTFSKEQDPDSYSDRAKDLTIQGFQWLGMAGGTVASKITGALASKIVELMGDDWTSEVASEKQTFQVTARSGGFVWQWEFAQFGDDKFSARLRTKTFMITYENKPPVCLPGQFADGDEPYGTCVETCCRAPAHYCDPEMSSDADKEDCPPCGSTGMCPIEVPTGVTAQPQCALTASNGDKYCALVCDPCMSGECGTGSCEIIDGVGLCTYAGDPTPAGVPTTFLRANATQPKSVVV